MNLPRSTTLFFAPTGQYAEAQIIELTPEIAQTKIHCDWWTDPALSKSFPPEPIDRWWNWNQITIEYGGRTLGSTTVAILTGDHAVQGAMLISTDPVPSVLDSGQSALFVELLFTAPRNRPALRADGKPFFLGVGTELLTWGAWLSEQRGFRGRILLDGSPDYVTWYERRGLQKLSAKPMVFEGVKYTPMELPLPAAQRLLQDW